MGTCAVPMPGCLAYVNFPDSDRQGHDLLSACSCLTPALRWWGVGDWEQDMEQKLLHGVQ